MFSPRRGKELTIMAKVSTKAFWSKDYTRALITASNVAVEQAILVVYGNQTSQEQVAGATVVDNGTGFTGADAEFGTSLAAQILKGWTLSVKQMAAARRMALRYWGQFAEALNAERVTLMLDPLAPTTRTVNSTTPSTPGRKAGTVDTSHFEPLFPDEDSWKDMAHQAKVEEHEMYDDELFAGEDIALAPYVPPVPTLRRLEDVTAEYKEDHEAMFATPEWVAFYKAIHDEQNAWLLMVEVSEGWIEGISVKEASEMYRKVEAERERVMNLLGLHEAARKSASYAAQWTNQFGDNLAGKRRWDKSPVREVVLGGLPIWVVANFPGVSVNRKVTA